MGKADKLLAKFLNSKKTTIKPNNAPSNPVTYGIYFARLDLFRKKIAPTPPKVQATNILSNKI